MSLTDQIPFLKKINDSRWGFLFFLIITVPISVAMYFYGICVFFVMFVLMAIPYYLGVRGVKKWAIMGIFIFVILTPIFGLISTYRAYDYTNYYANLPDGDKFLGPQESPFGILTNGTISPMNGDADTVFTFSVIYSNKTFAPVSVTAVVSDSWLEDDGNELRHPMQKVDPSDTNYTDGIEYEANTTLPDHLDDRFFEFPNHFYFFETIDSNGTVYSTKIRQGDYTVYALGPMNAPFLSVYAVNMVPAIGNMLFIVAFYYILVGMYWWLSKARERSTQWQDRMAEMEKEYEEYGDFECDRCGQEVPTDAKKCPRCGAVFEEEEEEKEKEEKDEED